MTIFKWDGGEAGYDADAIHVDQSGELSALVEKTVPVGNDVLLIEDSAGTYEKKYIKISNLQTTDPAAIHDNVSAEISVLTEKTTPVDADHLLIEDSAAANVKKRVLFSKVRDDPYAIHDNISAEISALTQKTTPVDADHLLIEDSAASNAKKRVLFSTVRDDPNAIHDNVAAEISAVTEKTALVADDLFIIEDSASSNAKKRVKQINVDPDRAVSVVFGDGVNDIPLNSVVRIPVPFAMTLQYWFLNSTAGLTSVSMNCVYYNGSTWDAVFSTTTYTGSNTGGSISNALQKHTVANERLLEFTITAGTVKSVTFTLTYKKTGNL